MDIEQRKELERLFWRYPLEIRKMSTQMQDHFEEYMRRISPEFFTKYILLYKGHE